MQRSRWCASEVASSRGWRPAHAHPFCTSFDNPMIDACRRTFKLLIATVVAYVLLAGSCLSAQNSAVHVSQLSHTAWRLRDGTLPGMPTMVTQTKDGYIWLGTDFGLYRFDGQRFVEVPLPSGSTPLILSLLADRDGSLWIGTVGGVFQERAGQIKEVVRGPRIEQLMQSTSGEIWAAVAYNSKDRPACVLRSGHFECWEHSALPYGVTIGQDDQGGIWISDRSALEHRERGVIIPQSAAERSLTRKVNVLSSNGSGVMWASSHTAGKLPTLLSRAGGIWRTAPALPGLTKSTDIQPIVVDREGATWVGTSDQGL